MDVQNRIGNLARLTSSVADAPVQGVGRNALKVKVPVGQGETQVQLSDEAKKRLADETRFNLGQYLIQATKASASSQPEQDGVDKRDERIKQLKEEIRELMAKITELIGKEDEASQQQAKVLQVELMSLNAQLMALLQEDLKPETS